DSNGTLDHMPFMPEMLPYCGKRFRVFKRADKTCDNILPWNMRRVRNAVHLMNVRCNGEAHANCDAGCLLFWNEGWLKRVDPHIEGTLVTTPTAELHLQPGEFVQVKSKEEILTTLDQRNRNRGLLFDSEMLRYCGGTYRVLKRVHQIVDEKTGKMLRMKSPC